MGLLDEALEYNEWKDKVFDTSKCSSCGSSSLNLVPAGLHGHWCQDCANILSLRPISQHTLPVLHFEVSPKGIAVLKGRYFIGTGEWDEHIKTLRQGTEGILSKNARTTIQPTGKVQRGRNINRARNPGSLGTGERPSKQPNETILQEETTNRELQDRKGTRMVRSARNGRGI